MLLVVPDTLNKFRGRKVNKGLFNTKYYSMQILWSHAKNILQSSEYDMGIKTHDNILCQSAP